MNEQQLPPLPESWLAEIYNHNTNERELSETGVAYYGSNWREVRKLYTSSQMHAYARAALAAQGVLADPCVVLWEAMNEAERVGNRSDDKLVVEFLRRAGYAITSIAGLATRSQRMAAAGFTARDGRLPCDECGKLFSVQMLPVHKCEGAAIEEEREDLRASQADAVMPMIGPLLDAWENADCDELDEELGKWLGKINRAMEDAEPLPAQAQQADTERVHQLLAALTTNDDAHARARFASELRSLYGVAPPQAQQVAPHPDTADAERYRWLRDNSATYSSLKVPIQLIAQEVWSSKFDGYRKHLDAAIDAARGIGASSKRSAE